MNTTSKLLNEEVVEAEKITTSEFKNATYVCKGSVVKKSSENKYKAAKSLQEKFDISYSSELGEVIIKEVIINSRELFVSNFDKLVESIGREILEDNNQGPLESSYSHFSILLDVEDIHGNNYRRPRSCFGKSTLIIKSEQTNKQETSSVEQDNNKAA